MKRRLLCLSLSALSIIGFSCEKNELTLPASNENEVSFGRGGGGGVDDEYCQNPAPASELIVEKNGQNNSGIEREGDVIITTFEDRVEVEYICDPGFQIKDVDVYIGPKSLAPVNNAGNPEFGQFTVRYNNLGNVQYYKAIVPRELITMSTSTNDEMISIVHGNIFKHNTESSYAKGRLFKHSGKAMFLHFSPCIW